MMSSFFCTKIYALAVAGCSLAYASKVLPATHGPPPGSDPLTWGFYATPEMQTPTKLHITGNIPKWVSGSLYRGAFATWDVGNYTAEHWFDGFSRNHRFAIENGDVSYHSRNASDELMDFVAETGTYPSGQFGSDPCKIIFGAFQATYRDGTNAHGDRDTDTIPVSFIPNFPGLARNTSSLGGPALDTLVYGTDANGLQQLDPVSLDPIELFTYNASNSQLGDMKRTAAHPARFADGTLFNYVLNQTTKPPTYQIFGMEPTTGETKILAEITDAPSAYIHSMFATDKHVILVVWQPHLIDELKTTTLQELKPFDTEAKTLFYVIDPKGDIVSKYESPDAFFAFHQINSFEDDAGNIFIDLPTYPDYGFLEAAMVENLRANLGSKENASSVNDLAASFARYQLPFHTNSKVSSNGALATHSAKREYKLPFCGANIELPVIHPDLVGKPYRFAYGIHVVKTGYFADSIIKIDTKTKGWKIWLPETKQLPTEPVFVPRPGAMAEDDGVLLVVVMDSVEKKSSLIVIDAVSMEEIAIAHMPIVMGYGFHGGFAANV